MSLLKIPNSGNVWREGSGDKGFVDWLTVAQPTRGRYYQTLQLVAGKVLWENHSVGTAAAPVNGFATRGPSVGVSVGKCQYMSPFYLLWVQHMHTWLNKKILQKNKFMFFIGFSFFHWF